MNEIHPSIHPSDDDNVTNTQTHTQDNLVSVKKEQVEFINLQPRSIDEYNHLHDHMISISESIKEKGVLQPPLAIPHPTHDNKFIIVAGRSRAIACFDMLHMETINILVKNMNEKEALQAAFEENAIRSSVNPIDDAIFIYKMESLHGKEAVTSMKGIAKRTLQQYLKIGKVLTHLSSDTLTQLRYKKYTIVHLKKLESVRMGSNQQLLEQRVLDALSAPTSPAKIEIIGTINNNPISGHATIKPRSTSITLKGDPNDMQTIITHLQKILTKTPQKKMSWLKKIITLNLNRNK